MGASVRAFKYTVNGDVAWNTHPYEIELTEEAAKELLEFLRLTPKNKRQPHIALLIKELKRAVNQ